MTLLHSGWKERECERIGLRSPCSPCTQLCSYGRALAEVFSISYEGIGNPSYTIVVHDGKRGQIIYKYNGRADQTISPEASNLGAQNGNNSHPLQLIGPYRAISLDGCVVIVFKHNDLCRGEILVDVEDPSTTFDEAITKVVHTCSCHNYPPAVVKYALLSNAVEAIVQVKLLQPQDDTIYGRIIARSNLGEVLLFQSNDENTLTKSSDETTIIPLVRSVLAVSLTSGLQIDVYLCGHKNGKIVKDYLTCQAQQNCDNVLYLGENRQVEVKITWSH